MKSMVLLFCGKEGFRWLGENRNLPFLVKISISDLNMRKGPGVNHSRVQFCPPGVYTIVAVSEGAGASMWGKLKSGIGWLSLDFCRRL